MENGTPRYVTAVGETDVADGWREKRVGGGVVIDVAANAVAARGLSMPHSPRLHEGRLWLLATERDGAGSTSDMMVAFHADRLEGPWVPHEANPILIDRAAARPGGAFVKVGQRIVRPVQDGTLGYGGGLGLSDLIRLDSKAVEFSTPVGILPARNWPHPRIHTLNRAGPLEVIDGLADVKRRGGGARAS